MRLRLGGFVADLTVIGFSRQAVVAIVIGCICLFGVIVAAMLIILMRKLRKPPRKPLRKCTARKSSGNDDLSSWHTPAGSHPGPGLGEAPADMASSAALAAVCVR